MLGISPFITILYKVHGAAGEEIVVSSGNIDHIITMIVIMIYLVLFFRSIQSRVKSQDSRLQTPVQILD